MVMFGIRHRCACEWQVALAEISLLDAALEALRVGTDGRKAVEHVHLHDGCLSLQFSKAVTYSAVHDWVKRRAPASKKRKARKQKDVKFLFLQEPKCKELSTATSGSVACPDDASFAGGARPCWRRLPLERPPPHGREQTLS